MHLQFISDGTGKTTGVYSPIEEWNVLKEKYKDIENNLEVPDWHKSIVEERAADYARNPRQGLNFDEAMNEIEKEL